MMNAQFNIKENLVNVQLIYIDGELMEIIIPKTEVDNLAVGDYIYYIFEGKYVTIRVIRKVENHLYLFILNFQESLNFINYNRNYPRFFFNLQGLLVDRSQVYPINIIDISNNGFGFLSTSELVLFNKYDLILHHDFFNINCEIIIQSQTLDKERYGSEITRIGDDELQKLQNYLFSLRLLIQ